MLAGENVVWGESHLPVICASFRKVRSWPRPGEDRGRGGLAGTVHFGSDTLRPHTWAGITDSGYFTNHDPQGDTLYGADVYVHPDARGLGVGHALYEARRELCRRLNLRRILAGGRLWNYDEQASECPLRNTPNAWWRVNSATWS